MNEHPTPASAVRSKTVGLWRWAWAALGIVALLGYLLWSGTWATGGSERSPAEEGAALTSADTHWPGEWANLLCPPDSTACADPDHAPTWPVDVPSALDETARARLAQHPWQAAGAVDGKPLVLEQDTPVHKLVGVYRGQRAPREGLQSTGSREVALLVYASQAHDNDCHACAPWGSFFQFEQVPSTPAPAWQLVHAAVGQEPVGSWGAMAPVHVLPLSHQALGVWFVASYMAQGFNSEALLVYSWVGEDWRQVFYASTGETDGNAEDDLSWQAYWRLSHDAGGVLTLDMATRFSPGAQDWAKAQGHESPQGRWRFDGRALSRLSQ